MLLLFQWDGAFSAERFEREDWIVSHEPTHPQYWGIQWGVQNLLLPGRIAQRGKRFLESRYANNWKFSSPTGGVAGGALRFMSTLLDIGIMMGSINLHHAMGHDAAAREHSLRFGVRGVPYRYQQVLPNLLGGGVLANSERNLSGGPDYQTQSLVQPMQAEMHFAYEQGKVILEDRAVNSAEALNFLFYRLRFYLDLPAEDGVVDQGSIDYRAKQYGRQSTITPAETQQYEGNKNYSTDFTHYVTQLNQRRYGVNQYSQFRYTLDDIHKSYYYQLLDPLQWICLLWRFGGKRESGFLESFTASPI